MSHGGHKRKRISDQSGNILWREVLHNEKEKDNPVMRLTFESRIDFKVKSSYNFHDVVFHECYYSKLLRFRGGSRK